MDSTTFSTGGGTFEVCPPGQDVLVCVDGVDLGHKVEEFKDEKAGSPTFGQPVKRLVRKYALVFQTAKVDKEGRRFAIVREFTASMGKTANLRKFVAAWLGIEVTDDIAKKFDPATLYSRNGLGTIINRTSGAGKLRAELQAIAPMFPGIPTIAPEGYERPKFIGMRKDDYAREAAAFLAGQGQRPQGTAIDRVVAQRSADETVAAMVQGVLGQADELPF